MNTFIRLTTIGASLALMATTASAEAEYPVSGTFCNTQAQMEDVFEQATVKGLGLSPAIKLVNEEVGVEHSCGHIGRNFLIAVKLKLLSTTEYKGKIYYLYSASMVGAVNQFRRRFAFQAHKVKDQFFYSTGPIRKTDRVTGL